MASFLHQKNLRFFSCEICDFKCSKKGDYNRHVLTAKHKMASFLHQKNIALTCELCNKTYVNRSGLYRHKKKCQKTQNIDISLVTELVKQNTELQNSLIMLSNKHESLVNSSNGNITNNIQNNIHNEIKPSFNINMFLNETCKDAMNFSDFIERIEVTHDDLENNAQLGFVQGITKIFMDNLNQLTIQERPIHCTDVKRETMYIREDDCWMKDEMKEKINSAIREVSRKSMKSLIQWKHTNPDYRDMDSEFSRKCIVMQQQSIAGDKTDVFYPKIAHNLARENAINKRILEL